MCLSTELFPVNPKQKQGCLETRVTEVCRFERWSKPCFQSQVGERTIWGLGLLGTPRGHSVTSDYTKDHKQGSEIQ